MGTQASTRKPQNSHTSSLVFVELRCSIGSGEMSTLRSTVLGSVAISGWWFCGANLSIETKGGRKAQPFWSTVNLNNL